jgi:hypothetical protein
MRVRESRGRPTSRRRRPTKKTGIETRDNRASHVGAWPAATRRQPDRPAPDNASEDTDGETAFETNAAHKPEIAAPPDEPDEGRAGRRFRMLRAFKDGRIILTPRKRKTAKGGSAAGGRTPPLSLAAGIVKDYLELCFYPAKDWMRWIAEDKRYKAAPQRGAGATSKAGNHVHTEGADSSLADTHGLRANPLHEMQSRMDADGRRGRGVDGVPVGSRADPNRYDRLRPVRTDGAGRLKRLCGAWRAAAAEFAKVSQSKSRPLDRSGTNAPRRLQPP